MQRRGLDFRDADAVISELRRLSSGYIILGNWNLTQICEHLSASIQIGLTGTDKRMPWFVRKILGRPILNRILGTRRMWSGLPAMKALVPKSSGVSEDYDCIQRCVTLHERAGNVEGPLPPDPFCDMTTEEWKQFTWIHAAHHLSFLAPIAESNGATVESEAEQQIAANSVRQQYFQSATGIIEFCDVGSGIPILYFHGTGAGNDAAVLLEQELIEAGCRLIVPNRPGYFRTSAGPRGSMDYVIELAAELLDHLKLERVAIIGTSGGGMPAAAFAHRYPQRAVALVLQCAQAHSWDRREWLPNAIRFTLPMFRHPASYRFLRWCNRVQTRRAVRHPETCLRQMSGSRFPLLREDARAEQRIAKLVKMSFECASQPRGLENDWTILVGEHTISPGTIDCPTLIIHDREDPLVPFRHAQWSHKSIPGSELLEVCAGGHLIWFGPDSREMNRKRVEFLRGSFSS